MSYERDSDEYDYISEAKEPGMVSYLDYITVVDELREVNEKSSVREVQERLDE